MRVGKYDKGAWVIHIAGEYYFLFEFSTPIWILPKIKPEFIKNKGWAIRVGWIMVAIGLLRRYKKVTP